MRFGDILSSPLKGLLAVFCLLAAPLLNADTQLPFKVHDIRVEGLQRLPVERVYAPCRFRPVTRLTVIR